VVFVRTVRNGPHNRRRSRTVRCNEFTRGCTDQLRLCDPAPRRVELIHIGQSIDNRAITRRDGASNDVALVIVTEGRFRS